MDVTYLFKDGMMATRKLLWVFSWKTVCHNQVFTIEPRHEKICVRDFRPAKTQTSLLSYRD